MKIEIFRKFFNSRRNLLLPLSKSIPLGWTIDVALNRKNKKFVSDHFFSFLRFGVGVSWIVGLINPITAGLILVGDGTLSIFKHRMKSMTQNLPMLVRIFVGLMMIPIVI